MSNFERRLRQSPNYVRARIAPTEYRPVFLSGKGPMPSGEEPHPIAQLDPAFWRFEAERVTRIFQSVGLGTGEGAQQEHE